MNSQKIKIKNLWNKQKKCAAEFYSAMKKKVKLSHLRGNGGNERASWGVKSARCRKTNTAWLVFRKTVERKLFGKRTHTSGGWEKGQHWRGVHRKNMVRRMEMPQWTQHFVQGMFADKEYKQTNLLKKHPTLRTWNSIPYPKCVPTTVVKYM